MGVPKVLGEHGLEVLVDRLPVNAFKFSYAVNSDTDLRTALGESADQVDHFLSQLVVARVYAALLEMTGIASQRDYADYQTGNDRSHRDRHGESISPPHRVLPRRVSVDRVIG
jgi:hypothetical protein